VADQIRAVWEFTKGQLLWMKTRERNAVFKNALAVAAGEWRTRYLGLRFTPYLKQRTFMYRGPNPVGKALASLGTNAKGAVRPNVGGSGELNIRVRGILQRVTGGWNPWSKLPPPQILVSQFRERNKGKYRFSLTGNFGGMLADLRKESKQKLKDAFRNLQADGHMLPLVLTGKLRQSAPGGKIISSATSKNVRCTVTTPFPGPRAAIVGAYIRTIPEAESAYVAKVFGNEILKTVNSRPASAAATQQRSAGIAVPRVA